MTKYDKIIINGDSYSALGQSGSYSTTLGEKLNVPVENIAVQGSNNDRIVRTTIEKVLSESSSNNRLLVIVGWSFVRRLEVWYYGNNYKVESKIPDRNNKQEHKNPRFVTLNMLSTLNELTIEQKCLVNEDLFVHKQLTDFYTNVYLLSQFLQNNAVDYLFFSAAKNVEIPLSSFPYIESLHQVQQVVSDKNIFDLHDFYIPAWAKNNDPNANSVTGHLSTYGHQKFADFLLEKINDI